MADSLRSIGSLVVGAIGFAVGGPLGFAVSTVLFNIVVPPKVPKTGGGGGGAESKNTAVDSPLYQVFGTVERSGGEVLRCWKNSDGVRSGIRVRTSEEGGGGSGGIGGGGSQQVESQFLSASFALCEGPTFIDKMIEETSAKGERVLFDRDNNVDSEVEVTDVLGAVSGDLVAQLSEHVRFYYGTEEQPVDTAEQEWYDEGVSADRGITKVVFSDYGPLEAGTTFRFWLRNSLTNRRDIITARLLRAGVPASRIDLRSIPEDLESFGWWVEGIEPARQLAEEVAAFSIHDLHFMATENGMVFTDISRANPTIVTIEDTETGAFASTGGVTEIPSSSGINLQGGESKPREIKVNARNLDKNLKDDGIVIQWPGAEGEPQTIDLRTVCHMSELFDFGEVTMRELQSMEGTQDVSLMPGRCQVAPGTVLDLPEPSEIEPNGRRKLRVVKQKVLPENIVACSTVKYDPLCYSPVDTPDVDGEPEPVITPRPNGEPEIIWVDSVSLSEEMSLRPVLIVGGRVEDGAEWGEISLSARAGMVAVDNPHGGHGGGGHESSDILLARPAVCGVLDTAYSYAPEAQYLFDYDTVLQITLDDHGSLASCSESDVLDLRANILWLDGFYCAYTTANHLTSKIVEITGLMPGIGGSDYDRSSAMGSRVMRITNEFGAISRGIAVVVWRDSKLNKDVNWEAVNTYNKRRRSNGTVKWLGRNLRVLSPAPDVRKVDDEAGGYYLHFWARSRNPEAGEGYWDGERPVRHPDPFIYYLQLYDNATDLNILAEYTVTSNNSELIQHLDAAELASVYPGGVPTPIKGRIRGANEAVGAGFYRHFEV